MISSSFYGITESISVSSTTADNSSDILYTCPDNHEAEVTLLLITNGHSSTTSINLQFYHKETNEWHYIARLHSIAGNTTYSPLSDSTLFLHQGDKLTVFKSSGTIDATISVKQMSSTLRIS
jgi:hypothetical protein